MQSATSFNGEPQAFEHALRGVSTGKNDQYDLQKRKREYKELKSAFEVWSEAIEYDWLTEMVVFLCELSIAGIASGGA